MKLTTFSLLLGISQAILLKSHNHQLSQQMTKNHQKIRDGDDVSYLATNDEEDENKPEDEVDRLMKAADAQEEHEKYLKSPEYQAEQAKKKQAAIDKEMEQTAELQTTLENLNEEGKTGQKIIGKKQLNFAQDDEVIQKLFDKYAEDGEDGLKVLKKDKAYQMSQKAMMKIKGMSEDDTATYLKDNFDKHWAEHDIHDKKEIDITEAYQLVKEIA